MVSSGSGRRCTARLARTSGQVSLKTLRGQHPQGGVLRAQSTSCSSTHMDCTTSIGAGEGGEITLWQCSKPRPFQATEALQGLLSESDSVSSGRTLPRPDNSYVQKIRACSSAIKHCRTRTCMQFMELQQQPQDPKLRNTLRSSIGLSSQNPSWHPGPRLLGLSQQRQSLRRHSSNGLDPLCT